MTAQSFENPLPCLPDVDGSNLQNGYVYIGEPDLDAITNPKAVYWDEALTIPVNQPLRTRGGYLWRNGAPARIWVDGNYSTLVQDQRGRQVFYAPNWSSASSVNVRFLQEGTGAVGRSVQAKLRDAVSVKDFGAVGDNATDDTVKIQAAMDFAFANRRALYFPGGSYVVSATLAPNFQDCYNLPHPGGNVMFGDGMGVTRLRYTPASGYCIDCTVNQNHVDSFTMMDMGINIDDAIGSASGVLMPQGWGQRFVRVHFDGAGPTGIGLFMDGTFGGGAYNYGNLISECRFHNITQNFLGQWLKVTGSLALEIMNSFFSVSMYNGPALQITEGRTVRMSGNQYETRHDGAFLLVQHLIDLVDCYGVTIGDPWFEGKTHASCIRVSAGCRNVQVNNAFMFSDNPAGFLVYSLCDGVVRVNGCMYQHELAAPAPTNAMLAQGGGLGSITFEGDYTNTTPAFTKLLGVDRVGATQPHQPNFSGELSIAVANVTGDGTSYTLLCQEAYDANANYNPATGVFMAPVTGRYQFWVAVFFESLDVAHTTGTVTLAAGTRGYIIWSGNIGAVRTVTNGFIVSGSVQADMTAGQTAVVSVLVSGGAKVVDIGTTFTRFQGALLM